MADEPDIIECDVCYTLIANRTASKLAHKQFHRMQVSPMALGMYLTEKEKQAGPPGA